MTLSLIQGVGGKFVLAVRVSLVCDEFVGSLSLWRDDIPLNAFEMLLTLHLHNVDNRNLKFTEKVYFWVIFG